MKKFFGVAAMVIALSTGAARSADLMSDPAYDWTGFYSGVHLGYTSLDGTYFADTVGNFKLKADGAQFGTLGGYNFQTNNIVLGVESDTSFGSLKDSNATIEEFKVDMASTLRLRAGVSVDRLLPFVSGGLALAHARSTDVGVGRDSNYHWGFAVGGGLEYAATDHLRVRAEYLYENFGKETYHIGRFNDTSKWDQHIARAAIIWAW
jgi:outer membrane immunogenic protein